MVKKIVPLFLFILLITFVSAGEYIQPVRQGNTMTLRQTCPDCIYVEFISMTYPNQTETAFEVNMSKSGETYTYSFGNTSQIGEYEFKSCGDLLHTSSNTRIVTCETITFPVTSNGEKVSLSNSIIVIVFLLIAGLLFGLGYSFNKEHWLLKSFFNFGSVGMGLLAINSAKIIASESSNLGKMGTTGLTFGIIIFLLFFIYIFVYAFIDIIKAMREKKGVRWKF